MAQRHRGSPNPAQQQSGARDQHEEEGGQHGQRGDGEQSYGRPQHNGRPGEDAQSSFGQGGAGEGSGRRGRQAWEEHQAARPYAFGQGLGDGQTEGRHPDDEDYEAWRGERRQKLGEDSDAWRKRRSQAVVDAGEAGREEGSRESSGKEASNNR